ncbi:isocitrate/isopropylmalate family dehydrogenase [Zhenpiania hominis]|uniref:Isocitrate/isopropylmalate dehydrogenase family protein n=1 Tax=Zhenpiania hominis TaxID=2763644 RepID=A0A923NNA5_9FIRM|nr:isocitrate/isopropylmalate family dehydrogenase [Zhenpiania hominis]MBC6680282.1 isocitrate/isopropylmalate dehydrogenase family protein [Zhenpiania hominis]
MSYMEAFETIVKDQLARVKRLAETSELTDYSKLDKIIIGTIDGDGIGPIIMDSCRKILEKLLADELAAGKIEIREIPGLTLENRIAKMETVPADVLAAIKECHVLLKGPTTTPGKGDNLPNIESANVTLRRELDLFANVRPVVIPEKNIDWIFYRENTEGEYALGSRGVDINDDISIDFKVTTTLGTTRLARAAFEYAKANGNKNVSIVTKANIMKKTDGKFLSLCYDVARDYPEIKTDDWYVDIMAANLVNDQINSNFNVVILPNLYGDIITDEAAQIQGGVGTAGSANVGGRYAMFEAIHGSAPRMIADGIGEYANPSSISRAAVMMLRHIGYSEKAAQLEDALDKAQKALDLPGDGTGNTASDFTDFVTENL